MKIKTANLIGPPLDWAVAKCEGYECQFDDEASGPWLVPQDGFLHDEKPLSMFSPSTAGDTVIDIMEREGISAMTASGHKGGRKWAAWQGDPPVLASEEITGPTLRIAAMRCFVASRLGDGVDVPEELMK